MARLFNQFFFIPSATYSERNCPDQYGRVFIITGGYSGVGFELSKILYAANAVVYIAGRSESQASAAIARIKDACPDGQGRLEFMNVDFADLTTIKPAVEGFLAKEDRLDVLNNNAGVMFPPENSKDAHGNELQTTVNCVGPCLMYKLLLPVLTKTAALSPRGSVRALWAGSVGIDVMSPKPGGMELEDSGKPKDKGVQPNYAQTKVGNLFLASEFAKDTPQNGIVQACYNPGNLRTSLQRHWGGFSAKMTDLLILQPAINGAYTELWAAIAPELTPEKSGAYVLPRGRIGTFRSDIQNSLKSTSEGGTGASIKFLAWCGKEIQKYT